ncbi:MAG: dephospho-CoA kinase [Pseudomonadota bacterium]|nr:dephospho-CoA kinase [Pseudomonadota bacterium]
MDFATLGEGSRHSLHAVDNDSIAKRIALTGGFGAGKSTVCAVFAGLGVPVIDADQIARELVTPSQPFLTLIVKTFGNDVLDSHGELRRAALRKIIFNDAARRKQLEAILHPHILQEMQLRAQSVRAPYCICCVPLLLETGQVSNFDLVVVVDTPIEIQLERVMQRDHLTAEEAKAIIRIQASREERLEAADYVLTNDANLAHIQRQVHALHKRYLAYANSQ